MDGWMDGWMDGCADHMRSFFISLKEEFFLFIRDLKPDGSLKSVEVKFFTVAFFGGCRASSMMTPDIDNVFWT